MKSHAIKTLPGTVVTFAFVTAALGIGLETSAQAQTAAAADAVWANMPTKRPALPPNSDRMLHNNPASDAIAK
jgi:hypothetical protein